MRQAERRFIVTSINLCSVKLVKEKTVKYDAESLKILSPESVVGALNIILDLQNDAVKKVGIIALNTKNKVVGVHIISVGSLNASIVHPREIYKSAILNNSSTIIMFHNHPSGDPTPSQEDIGITKRIFEAGKILGIELLDHLIIGEDKFVSLKQKNII